MPTKKDQNPVRYPQGAGPQDIKFAFEGEVLRISFAGLYAATQTPKLQIWAKYEPYATLTLCEPGTEVPNGLLHIKDYSENQPVFEHLVRLGVLEPTLTPCNVGVICKYHPEKGMK